MSLTDVTAAVRPGWGMMHVAALSRTANDGAAGPIRHCNPEAARYVESLRLRRSSQPATHLMEIPAGARVLLSAYLFAITCSRTCFVVEVPTAGGPHRVAGGMWAYRERLFQGTN